MENIFAITCFIAVVISCKKLYDRFVIPDSEQEQEQEEQQYNISDYQQIKQQVTALQQTIQRIDSLNNLIIDISVCSPESLKNVSITIPDSVSNNSKHDFLITGTDTNSRLLQTIAEEEKQQLVSHLLRQIENLYQLICSNANSNANEPYSMKGEFDHE